uniref:Uncharacterized protein n=1 Tax=Ditylum brightwellii TaxID=49249 RepID=A0A6S8YD18_9STRA|mmetsp:Transcript_24873/g.37085  ORF Transcript_24873/g.37085 Transcript_24873/m.37085 type:complete len:427 (+) Transcript_24873:91-1371(+)
MFNAETSTTASTTTTKTTSSATSKDNTLSHDPSLLCITQNRSSSQEMQGENMEDAAHKSKAVVVAPSSSKSNPSKGCDNEDTVLFESMASHLVDTLGSSVQTSLSEQVSKLPLLPGRKSEPGGATDRTTAAGENVDEYMGGEERLMSMLRKSYGKNIDIIESYTNRNIFSIRMFGKVKRRTVVERYMNQEEGKFGDDGSSKTSPIEVSARATHYEKEMILGSYHNNSNAELESIKHQYGSPIAKSEIPTTEQVNALDDEIRNLRERFRSLQRDKLILLAKHKRLSKISGSTKRAHILYDEAISGESSKNNGAGEEGKLEDSVTVNILNSASGAIMGTEALSNLTARSTELMDIMDDLKAKRSKEEEKENMVEVLDLKDKRKKDEEIVQLSLEEDYEERMKNWGEAGGGDIAGVKRVLSRLSKKRKR